MRALDDLVRQGKILYTGVSNAPAWIVAQANTLADLRGWTPFAGLQVEYNLIERDAERDLLPMARALDVGVTAWTPLASGWLTGKYAGPSGDAPPSPPGGELRRLDDPVMGRFVPRDARSQAIAGEVVAVARELGCAPAHVALNWLRHQGTIPIFGARRAEQVRENAACFDHDLPAEHLKRLNDVSKIPLGYPHAFLASSIVKHFVYGGLYDRIDQHRALRPG
jgi:aryl-alcohol dehydrogenase-like predicted oxidoreductase